MIVIVAIAAMVVVAASAWPVSGRARRARRERRLLRAEAARGIAALETMLAERGSQAGTRPGSRGGESATGDNAPNPQA
jgi:Flp pilus assembly protein TadB